MKYKIFVSMNKLETGMVSAEPILSEKNGVMLVPSGALITDSIIEKLKHHNIQVVNVFSDKPPEEIIEGPCISEELPEAVFAAHKTSDKPPGSSIVMATKIGDKQPRQRSIIISNELFVPKVEPILDEKLKSKALGSIKELCAIAAGSTMTTAHHVVKELDNIVDQLVNTVTSDISGLAHITSLKSYDEYTYHHSLSVALLSIAIGKQLGIDKWELKRLGKGALMHDIGKMMIPIEILNKTARLTNEEFDIMKTHAQKGGKYLQQNGIGDGGLWEIVGCHHEKVDGTGYHKGLKGNRIPIFSRITAVADVYDALTSYRPYRKPMSPSTAFEAISGDVGKIFDYDVVNAFMKKIDLYPANTVVELSNKRIGIVVESNYTLRPVLRMLDDGQMLDLCSPNNLNLVIEHVIEDYEIAE